MKKIACQLIAILSVFHSCTLIKERNSYLLEPDVLSDGVTYPLVIFLHGAGGAGEMDFLKNIGITKYTDLQNPYTNHLLKSEMSCFLWIPETRGNWDTRLLIHRIEKIKRKYPIDIDRIYVIGYSMGGSASYRLANDYFKNKNQLFAAIVRLAGQSETILESEVAANTAVWLQIGLQDNPQRIDVTQKAYSFLKNYHINYNEIETDTILDNKYGKTFTLVDGINEKVKYTKYDNVGHGIAGFPFQDISLIKWIFEKHLN